MHMPIVLIDHVAPKKTFLKSQVAKETKLAEFENISDPT
jgi:hypothetical protein